MANYPKPKKGSRHNANTGYRPHVRRQLHEERAARAKVRQGLYDKLSPQERLARLDRGNAYSDGRPLVATKQRARIEAQLKAIETPVAVPETTKAPKKARKEKKS